MNTAWDWQLTNALPLNFPFSDFIPPNNENNGGQFQSIRNLTMGSILTLPTTLLEFAGIYTLLD